MGEQSLGNNEMNIGRMQCLLLPFRLQQESFNMNQGDGYYKVSVFILLLFVGFVNLDW